MKRETSYEIWLKEEGVPIIEGYGIEDITALPRKPWKRTGGAGATEIRKRNPSSWRKSL